MAKTSQPRKTRQAPFKQNKLLSLRVQLAMQRQGLNIPQVTRASGIALNIVQKIYAGDVIDPSVWTVKRLAKALGTSIDALVEE